MSKQSNLINASQDITVNSSGNVGIGTDSPSALLHAEGAARFGADTGGTFNGHIRTIANDRYPALGFYSGSTLSARFWNDVSTGDVLIESVSGNLRFEADNTERMRIDSAGRVTMPYQPSFKVATNYSSNPYINGATLLYTAVEYDVGNNFANSRFTAPVAGVYHFDASVFVNTAAAGQGYSYMALAKNGNVSGPYTHTDNGNITSYHTLSISKTIQLAANDYVQVYVFNNPSHRVFNGTGYNHFSGHLIG
jgi:hypothetical protein